MKITIIGSGNAGLIHAAKLIEMDIKWSSENFNAINDDFQYHQGGGRL